MRKVICLLLALSFCVALACPAFAANTPSRDHVHDWENGKCDCGATCNHTWKNGKCTICGKSFVCSWSGSNPKTGDTIMPYAVPMVVSLSALAAVAVVYRKKEA